MYTLRPHMRAAKGAGRAGVAAFVTFERHGLSQPFIRPADCNYCYDFDTLVWYTPWAGVCWTNCHQPAKDAFFSLLPPATWQQETDIRWATDVDAFDDFTDEVVGIRNVVKAHTRTNKVEIYVFTETKKHPMGVWKTMFALLNPQSFESVELEPASAPTSQLQPLWPQELLDYFAHAPGTVHLKSKRSAKNADTKDPFFVVTADTDPCEYCNIECADILTHLATDG